MNNCSNFPAKNWPQRENEYITAWDFEVYDFAKGCAIMSNNTRFIISVCVLYVTGIFVGQRLMRDRPAFKLKGPLFLWNCALAIFSTLGFMRVAPESFYILTHKNGFYNACCVTEQHNYATSFWALAMIMSKFVELGDTAFIVLRKRKLIFLHWYHHLTVFFFGFTFYDTYDPLFRVAGTVNYGVHSIMYSYYALKTVNIRVPQKMSMVITAAQILQMIVGLVGNCYTCVVKIQGIPCGRPWSNVFYGFMVGGTYLILFVNYFKQTYIRHPPRPAISKEAKIQPGISTAATKELKAQ